MAPGHAHRPDENAFALQLHREEPGRAAAERDDRVLALQLFLEDTGATAKPFSFFSFFSRKGKAPTPTVRAEEHQNMRALAEALVCENETIAQQMPLREMRPARTLALAEAPVWIGLRIRFGFRVTRYETQHRRVVFTVPFRGRGDDETNPRGGETHGRRRVVRSGTPRNSAQVSVPPPKIKLTAPLGALVGKCVICMEEVSEDTLVSAKVAQRWVRKSCGHSVCDVCVKEWLKNEINDQRDAPRCPRFQECDACFDKNLCEDILGRGSDLYEKLVTFNTPEARGVRDGTLMYCPSGCNTAVEARGYGKRVCKTCGKRYCAACKVPWHDNLSCTEYQNLPPHMKTPNDVAFLNLAFQELFRRCPKCRSLVEKIRGGCNQVVCRCGCTFCYGCGSKYVYKSIQDRFFSLFSQRGYMQSKCTYHGRQQRYASVSDVASSSGASGSRYAERK
jgi:hypothetical protein